MSDEETYENFDDVAKTDVNVLDPRAGFVDVVLPQLKFSSKQILQLLEQYKFHPGSTVKSRKTLSRLISL